MKKPILALYFALIAPLLAATPAIAASIQFKPWAMIAYDCVPGHESTCKREAPLFATAIIQINNGIGTWNFTQDLGEASFWVNISVYEDEPGLYTIIAQGNVFRPGSRDDFNWAYFQADLAPGESIRRIESATMPLLIGERSNYLGFAMTELKALP